MKISRDANYITYITEREFKEEICRSLLYNISEVKSNYDSLSLVPYKYQKISLYTENKKGFIRDVHYIR